MTYSVESLVFRAVAGVVNTAARAANGLLEVMYPPRYDAAHIWDDSLPVGDGRLCEGCVRDTCPDVCPYMPDFSPNAQNFPGAAGSLADGCDSHWGLLRNPSVSEDEQQEDSPGYGSPAGPQPDVPACSVASGGPAPTDPPSGGVADPAAEKVNPPDLSAAGSLNPDLVSFFELQCIAEEILRGHLLEGPVGGAHLFTCSCREQFRLVGEWSDHVAEIQISAITDRLRVAHIAAASFQPE